MAKHVSVYQWSLKEAQKLGEVDLWRESYKENCTCARAIEQAIDDNYADNRLNTDAAKDIIERFGYNRVNWVLANTISVRIRMADSVSPIKIGQTVSISPAMTFVGTLR